MRTAMRITKNEGKGVLVALLLLMFTAQGRSATAPVCGKGVALRLSAPAAAQGTVLLAEIRSSGDLQDVTGKWMERELYFWRVEAPGVAAKGQRAKNPSETWRAIVGVDLEKAAGRYDLSVVAKASDGGTVECNTALAIRAGKFATERLKVEQQFVEPNPEQAKRAQTEQQKLRQIFDHVTPEKLWQGTFRFPLDGATKGSNFGKRRILNGQPRPPHTGADFPALTGTPVHATQAGRVVVAEELFFSGNTVIVDHGLGIYSLYGHLSAIDVAAGDEVKAGTLLGKVGATGRVTGPHLHWGVTVNRARVDPVRMVSLFQAQTAARTARKKAR
jgi:murein DD-endopeptidase MepM/ murein hydrolase activator NlpD